ncbi:hypothetical protein AB0B48_15735, partial [Micromonospora sp. NPDC049089]
GECRRPRRRRPAGAGRGGSVAGEAARRRPEYGFLPPAQRQRALLAKPGTMFVNQPDIPVPLCLEFPFPAWATRVSEAGRAPSETLRSITQSADPFAVVGSGGGTDDDIPF